MVVRLATLGIIAAFGAGSVLAEDGGAIGHGGTSEAHRHANKFEFVLSNTHTEHGENAVTAAMSYHRRISPLVSVGVLGEYAFGDIDTGIVGIPVKLYPGQGWVFTGMPGVEIHDSNTEGLFRVGVGYEFELEGFSLTPEVNADFVDGETNIVTGISIGFGF